MFARTLTVFLVAASTVAAWPIFFYPSNDCHSEPITVLEGPPKPGVCGYFPEEVRSYSGGTADNIQKVLLYYNPEICEKDAAHRVYSNHTINNSENKCIPFKKAKETPRAYVFIEEFLPIPPKNSSVNACNAPALVVQS